MAKVENSEGQNSCYGREYYIELLRKNNENIKSHRGKNIALVRTSDLETQLSVIVNLLGGLHILAIWFWALFPFFWGLAFIKLEGKNKIVGVLFLFLALLAILFYAFLMVENICIASICHLLAHVVFIVSQFFLALILIAESKKEGQQTA